MSRQRVQQLYLPHVAAVRQRLQTEPALKALMDPRVEPALVEGFLLQLHSLGVYMTEPVEGWIRRAGEATVKLGLEDVGQQLITHAKHEAGHHLLMMEDTRRLVARWNARRTPRLDADALLQQTPTPAMREYRELHEDTLAGPLPAAQVAIEYEIEHLSVVFGPGLMAQARHACGEDILEALSFVKEHVELDVGHTALNEVMLEKLLAWSPGEATLLGQTGARALDIYLRFLGDCVERARLLPGQGCREEGTDALLQRTAS